MAIVTRENIRSQFRGEKLVIIPAATNRPVLGRFVRTNWVTGEGGEQFLFVTVDVLEGPDAGLQRVFDVDLVQIFNQE